MKATIWIWIFCTFTLAFSTVNALAETTTEQWVDTIDGEEITIHIHTATGSDGEASAKPLLIWFSEGYRQRDSFQHLLTQLNDHQYDIWQVDMLESLFLERNKENVRGLNGTGIAAVLQAAEQSGRPYATVTTGRMSLAVLRGIRRHQQALGHQGHLLANVLFFPNLFNASEKAGDLPKLFPIANATRVPTIIMQPEEGTYKWQLPRLLTALEANDSPTLVQGIANVRDWYFLRRNTSDAEKQQAQAIPRLLEQNLSLIQQWQAPLSAVADLKPMTIIQPKQGLVSINDQPAANPFQLIDTNGQIQQLSDYANKVVLLNFWASWCGPCVHEIPSMNALQQQFSATDFAIVSVNFKESPDTIQTFLNEVDVDFTVLLDEDGKVANDWHIFAFPSSFLLNRQHQITHSVNAAIDWTEPHIVQQVQQLIQQQALQP